MVQRQNVIIFGGSGAIGAAAARVFAREGAQVLLVARDPQRLSQAARPIVQAGGKVDTLSLDVLDEVGTRGAIAAAAERFGGIDVALHATSFMHDQGRSIDKLDLATFMQPLNTFLPALFNATRATVPFMGGTRPGVILTLSTPAGRMAAPGHLGHSATSAAIESFTRVLAAELGPRNIRVVCLAPHAISDAVGAGSYTRQLFEPKASALGLSVEEWLAGAAATTFPGHLPTLSEVAETALFLASRHARSMTASYVNMTAGAVPE
jgi:NAD(P)-dependent dehydrogenase (short-subunit alcohol dehydrogenase family)